MDNYKKEISILHDKNMQSTVDAQTAKLRANLNNASTEITELRATLAKKKFNIIHFIIAVLLGALLGYFIFRLL